MVLNFFNYKKQKTENRKQLTLNKTELEIMNHLERIKDWHGHLDYKGLQDTLRGYRIQGETTIKLNSKAEILKAEYERIINKIYGEKLETEQSAKDSEVMAVEVTAVKKILFNRGRHFCLYQR